MMSFKISRNVILVVAAAILLALTIFFLYRGCSCLRAHEGFEGAKDKEGEETLTSEEIALFEDLKADKYSAKEIDEMVTSGVIDQGLVEKFLNKLDTFDEVAAETKPAKPEVSNEAEKPKGKPIPKPTKKA